MNQFDFDAERRMLKIRELLSKSKKKKEKLQKEEIPRSIKSIEMSNITYSDHFIIQLEKRFDFTLNHRMKRSLLRRLQENYKGWNIFRVKDKNHKTRFAVFSKSKKYVFDYMDDKFVFVTVMPR